MLNKQAYIVFSVLVLMCLIRCTENRKPNQITSNKNLNEQLIVGTWEDANSIVAYTEKNTFDGWFGKDKKRLNGFYEIVSDTLKIRFATHEHNPEYIIEKMDSHLFEIRSLDDAAVFTKRRIKFVE